MEGSTTTAETLSRDGATSRWSRIVQAFKQAFADQVTDSAAAVAYYGFLAIPAVLLVAIGVFGMLASPAAIESVVARLDGLLSAESLALIDDTLTQATDNRTGPLAILVVGFLLALWTSIGAMNTLMQRLNDIHGIDETRGFVGKRAIGLAMLAWVFLALALAFGILVLGPHLSGWIGSALGIESVFGWLWWGVQWPILIVGLLGAFAGILYLGPNTPSRGWRLISTGSVLAVALWLLASGLFTVYVSQFGSYNKAWGSLAGVVILLIWLWLGGLALLLGAAVDAELSRDYEPEPPRQQDRPPT